jgi:uncharacterized protein YdiU (UPF0061 family)
MKATASDFTDTFVAITEYTQELVDGAEPSTAAQTLLTRLLSRCASPSAQSDFIKRSVRVSRLSMGLMPQQIDMVWGLLQSDDVGVQEQVAAMFGDVPVQVVKSEVGAEKRKLDKIRQGGVDVKALESVTSEGKAAVNRGVWSEWVEAYTVVASTRSASELRGSLDAMRRLNPTFVLRNWVAQVAITAAENGDFSKVRTVLGMLETPFEPSFSTFRSSESGSCHPVQSYNEFLKTGPEWANRLICTCSS